MPYVSYLTLCTSATECSSSFHAPPPSPYLVSVHNLRPSTPTVSLPQSLSLEGVSPGSVQGSLGVLTGLTCLRFAETHHRPMAQDASAIPPTRNKGVTAAAMLHMQMHVPRAVPNQAPTLRALHLPDVTVGPMEWPALLRLCPLLQELEVASALPPRKELVPQALPEGHRPPRPSAAAAQAAAAAAMASGASGSVPDWFVRATAGDEAVLSHGTNSGSSARNVRNGDGSLDSGPKNGADEVRGQHGGAAAGGGCPFATAFGGSGGSGGGTAAAGKAAGPPGKSAVAGLLTLRGVNRLVMWHYMGPHDMMLLLQHMPDVQELHVSKSGAERDREWRREGVAQLGRWPVASVGDAKFVMCCLRHNAGTRWGSSDSPAAQLHVTDGGVSWLLLTLTRAAPHHRIPRLPCRPR